MTIEIIPAIFVDLLSEPSIHPSSVGGTIDRKKAITLDEDSDKSIPAKALNAPTGSLPHASNESERIYRLSDLGLLGRYSLGTVTNKNRTAPIKAPMIGRGTPVYFASELFNIFPFIAGSLLPRAWGFSRLLR